MTFISMLVFLQLPFMVFMAYGFMAENLQGKVITPLFMIVIPLFIFPLLMARLKSVTSSRGILVLMFWSLVFVLMGVCVVSQILSLFLDGSVNQDVLNSQKQVSFCLFTSVLHLLLELNVILLMAKKKERKECDSVSFKFCSSYFWFHFELFRPHSC